MKLEIRECVQIGSEIFTEGDIVNIKFNSLGISEYGIFELNNIEIEVINEEKVFFTNGEYFDWYDIESIEKIKTQRSK